MRLFQNSDFYPGYAPRLRMLDNGCTSFAEARRAFLKDRFGACHILMPVLAEDPAAFYANGCDDKTQRMWAVEHGMAAGASLREILLAQIEEHRTEVFYNLDPMNFQSKFIRALPGCVQCSIAWRAAPSPGADFAAYDRVVSNFPGILQGYAAIGWNVGHLFPAIDPVMEDYAQLASRPVDVVFVGGYSRHHRQRVEILEAVAERCPELRIAYHLDCSRMTRLAESPIGLIPPLRGHRRPNAIRRITQPAVFGRALYEVLGSAKIVLNGAIDMAGRERGNMRCFEATGCGALLVTDEGLYPREFIDGETMLIYRSPDEVVEVIRRALADPDGLRALAARGHAGIRAAYSKEAQWRAFLALVEGV